MHGRPTLAVPRLEVDHEHMSHSVVVVGGGPAGMVVGLLLARAGITVTVLEKHADFLRDFRGDTVHPSTLTLLDDLGLYPELAALPQSRLGGLDLPQADGTSVRAVDVSRLPVPHPFIAMVPQWDLLQLLATAASREPHFTLLMRTEATGLIFHDDGRVTGVSTSAPEGAGEHTVDLVVACDGRHSVLREQAQLPVRRFPVSFDVWWFRVPYPGRAAGSLLPRLRPGAAVIAIPRLGYLQAAFLGRKGMDGQLRSLGIAAFRDLVRGLLPEKAQVDELHSMDEVKHLAVRVDRLTRWHTEGLLAIGDAAHAMSPVGGVGINLAVQDAVATARLLAPSLRAGTTSAHDLSRVRRRRLLPTIVVQRLQRTLHSRLIDRVLSGTLAEPPRTLIAVLRRAPWLASIPGYLIGVGLLSERAPDWARRPPQPAPSETRFISRCP